MAFNPVHFFRKYQKLGMALVLLMCMISFVLCSGDRGGPMEWVMGGKRVKGPLVAKIAGVNYYSADMHELKQGRQIANDFMKRTLEKLKIITEKKIETMMADKNMDAKTREGKLLPIQSTKKLIEERLKRPRFFDGGVKLEELVDFKLWLLEAERLRIPDMSEYLRRLLAFEFSQATTGYDEYVLRDVLMEVHQQFGNASNATIWQSLSNEYRVQMARLAMITTQPTVATRIPRDTVFALRHVLPKRPFEPLKEARNPSNLPYPFEMVRVPVSPAELVQWYVEKRSEFNLAMVPVVVDDFLKTQPDPTEPEVQQFFKENMKKRYDPTSEDSGFEVPTQIKVTMVRAKIDLAAIKTKVQVETAERFYWYSGFPQPPTGTGLTYAASLIAAQLAGAERERELYQTFFNKDMALSNDNPATFGPFVAPPLTRDFQESLLAFEAKGIPQAGASLIGALSSPNGLTGFPLAFAAAPLNVANFVHGGTEYERQQALKKQISDTKDEPARKQLEAELAKSFPGVDDENRQLLRERAQKQSFLVASLVGIGPHWGTITRPAPVLSLGDWLPTVLWQNHRAWLAWAEDKPSFGPIDMPGYLFQKYKEQYEKEQVRKLAIREAQQSMQAARKALQAEKVSGDGAAIFNALNFDLKDQSIEVVTTSKLYDRYDIKEAPELKPLYDSYEKWYKTIDIIEGREPETAFKPGEFDRILFDKESFLTPDGRAEKSGPYDVHAWPPVLPNKAGKAFAAGREVEDVAPGAPRQTTIDLFTFSDDPILFWISRKDPARFPDKLLTQEELDARLNDLTQKFEAALFEGGVLFLGKDRFTPLQKALDELQGERELRRRVVTAWKISKAREKLAMPRVETIAAHLEERSVQPPLDLARNEVSNLNDDLKLPSPRVLIEMKNIAPLNAERANEVGRITGYSNVYSMPRDKEFKVLLYPTEQMPQQLLMFGNPKNAIKTGYKPVDDLNEKLFKDYQNSIADKSKSKHLVQVFVNKPHDRFFVTVLEAPPRADLNAFFESYRMPPRMLQINKKFEFLPGDPFIFEAYNGIAEKDYEAMIKEMWKAKDVWVTDHAEDRKNFDSAE